MSTMKIFVLTRQRDPHVRCESLEKICQFQFIMNDFWFENKFCQHFQYLRENTEVFVRFNIDRCQSILNNKMTISRCYNNKLDVENENSRLDKFTVKCNVNERGWQTPCEIATYVSDIHMGPFFSAQNLLTLLLPSIDDQLTTRLLPTMRIDSCNKTDDNIQNFL